MANVMFDGRDFWFAPNAAETDAIFESIVMAYYYAESFDSWTDAAPELGKANEALAALEACGVL